MHAPIERTEMVIRAEGGYERGARARLEEARQLMQDIVAEYPGTSAAAEAQAALQAIEAANTPDSWETPLRRLETLDPHVGRRSTQP